MLNVSGCVRCMRLALGVWLDGDEFGIKLGFICAPKVSEARALLVGRAWLPAVCAGWLGIKGRRWFGKNIIPHIVTFSDSLPLTQRITADLTRHAEPVLACVGEQINRRTVSFRSRVSAWHRVGFGR